MFNRWLPSGAFILTAVLLFGPGCGANSAALAPTGEVTLPQTAVVTPHLAAEYSIPTAGSGPTGITKGPDGNLWFAESVANKVGSITPGGSFAEFQVPNPSNTIRINDIVAGPDGNLWFTESQTTPRRCGGFPPHQVCFGPFFGGYVRKVTTAGTISPYIAGGPVGGFAGSIAGGPDGNLWFTRGYSINRITPSGSLSRFATPQGNGYPTDIVRGADGNMWFTQGCVSNLCAVSIGKITPSGLVEEFPVPSPSGNLTGISPGPDSNLWFTESDANKIGRITPAGTVTEFAIPTATSGPAGIVSGPDGNLWFTEYSTNKIARITPTGRITEYSITAGSAPFDITVGPDENLWFTESGSNKIGKFVP